MAETIDWNLTVTVTGGPKASVSRNLKVDAYDKVGGTVPKKNGGTAGTVSINVQPSAAGGVSLLLITSSLYSDKLTYKVDSGTEIKLDAPQFFTGTGLVGLLGGQQKVFDFKNDVDSSPADAVIEILVGRKAVS